MLNKAKLNTMKRILLFSMILIFVVVSSINAQQKNALISFKKTVYDFGTIKEDVGLVTYNFEFVNSGKSPLVIQRVITSCDCTASEWTKEPLAPGAAGSIKVVYNPKGRPGPIDKAITVYSNAETPTVVLQIKGNVQEPPKKLEEIYTREIGDFRFRTNHLSFDRMLIDKIKIDTLEFISIAKEPVKIGCRISGLPHLTVRFVPETLKPNEKGLMIVKFDAQKRNDWGFVIDRFYLTQNDKDIKDGLISISASIEENFSTLTEVQRTNAPKIEFAQTSYGFGQIDEGQLVEYDFVFTNTGKSDLVIRKIKASCGCTTVDPFDKLIKPGQTSTFKASFKTNGYSGRNSKSITVISNDPVLPTIVLRMTGIINSTQK